VISKKKNARISIPENRTAGWISPISIGALHFGGMV